MEFEESVYNLIPKERYEPAKDKMYKSKHSAQVPPTGSTFCLGTTSKPGLGNLAGETVGANNQHKGAGATMGQPLGSVKPQTTDFRKKGTGTFTLPESKSTQYLHVILSFPHQ